jgi:hypothetical protein
LPPAASDFLSDLECSSWPLAVSGETWRIYHATSSSRERTAWHRVQPRDGFETSRMRLGYDRARVLIRHHTGLSLHHLHHSDPQTHGHRTSSLSVTPANSTSASPWHQVVLAHFPSPNDSTVAEEFRAGHDGITGPVARARWPRRVVRCGAWSSPVKGTRGLAVDCGKLSSVKRPSVRISSQASVMRT